MTGRQSVRAGLRRWIQKTRFSETAPTPNLRFFPASFFAGYERICVDLGGDWVEHSPRPAKTGNFLKQSERLKTMFKSKIEDRLAELEAAVADAARDVARTRQAHRDACQALADARASLAEAPNSDALSNTVSQAFDDAGQRSSELGLAMERLAEAERNLLVYREAPQRAQTAASLKARKARISALRNELLPGLRDLRAEIVETHHNGLLFSLPGASKQIHGSLLDHLDFLVSHLEAQGGLTSFLDHMATYASGVVDGSRPLDLGANYAAEKRRLAKAS